MDSPILFGRFLVREGKITEKELTDSLRVQAEINRSFAAAAVEGGFITLEDFKKAAAYQREKGIRFRDSLIELKITDVETIEKIDKAFKESAVRLGELLLKRGTITENDLNEALTGFKERGTLALS